MKNKVIILIFTTDQGNAQLKKIHKSAGGKKEAINGQVNQETK